MAEIITVYGERRPLNPKGEHFTLEELQEAVGGCIEFAYPPNGKVLVINEDGKGLKLLANAEATKIFLGINNLDDYPGVLNNPHTRVNGDVVLCDLQELE